MLKILLVYDDFQELTSVELMLKKIGFDVVGITSEFSLTEQLLSFNPHVVIAQGQTPKVSTAGVGRRLRESVRWDGHCVLIFYPKAKPQPAEILKMRMDVGLEYPVEPTKLVQVLAQLGGLDSHYLLDKLIKTLSQDQGTHEDGGPESMGGRAANESVYVVGGKSNDDTNATLTLTTDPSSQSVPGAHSPTPEAPTAQRPGEKPKSQEAGSLSETLAKDAEIKAKSLFPGPAVTGDQPTTPNPHLRKARAEENTKEESSRSKKERHSLQDEKSAPTANSPSEGEVLSLNAKSKKSPEEVSSALDSGKKPSTEENLFSVDMIKDPVLEELEGLLSKTKTKISDDAILLHDPRRAEKYAQIVGSLPPIDLLSIRRREAKSRLRHMIQDIPKEELRNQDDLRREFVKALFKPKT